jgi:hypothetical protein
MPKTDYSYEGNFNKAALGQNGVKHLKSGEESPTDVVYIGICALKDSVFSSDLSNNEGDEISDTSVTALELKTGLTILGNFSNIDLTSGELWLYKG